MLEGETIASVSVLTYQAALDVCDNPTPESEYQAKFSLYHCVAIALLDGRVGLDSFTAEARERCRSLCAVTRVEVKDPYKSAYPVSWGAEVTVTTESGQTFKVSRRDCKGDPELALNDNDMRKKAMDLIKHGALDSNEAAAVCDAVLQMPQSESSPRIFSDFMGRLH